MFINNGLTFIDSSKVRVFPCGRRRSLINNGSVSDKAYLPFDAEARLNTEANNRKHSSLNGFTQSYIRGLDNGILSIAIGGYLFEVQLDSTLAVFAESVTSTDTLYANIKLEEVMLFAGTLDGTIPPAKTKILRDQTVAQTPETCLDVPYSNNSGTGYYFSGLSFSSEKNIPEEASALQQVISLQIADKINGSWQLHEASKLPNIAHGDRENSIKVGIVEADEINCSGTITAQYIKIGANGDPAASLKVVDTGKNTYQLRFSI